MPKLFSSENIAKKVFLAMILGTITGLVLQDKASEIKFLGDIFLNLLKMTIVPTIFIIVSAAVCGTKESGEMGQIGLKAVIFYLITTLAAALIGTGIGLIFDPGVGFSFTGTENVAALDIKEMSTWQAFLTSLFPKNIIASMAKGNIIHVMIAALLSGFALKAVAKQHHEVYGVMDVLTEFVQKLVGLVIAISPIGVFALMANTAGHYGLAMFGSIGALIGLFYLGCVAHFLLVYSTIARLKIGIGPWELIKRCYEQVVFTVATTSSVATLPISIRTATEKFNVRASVANFCIPLGSQMNKDGNGVLLPIVLIFTGNAAGIDFSSMDILMMTGFTILMTLGGGGIPGSGIVKVAVVAQAFHLPLDIVAIVAGIYRLLDMGITSLNCLGDVVIAAAIDSQHAEKELAELQNG